MNNHTLIMLFLLLIVPSAVQGEDASDSARQDSGSYATIGLFIAGIEEGARIFTPIRLLPFEHPESEGPEFPNALQLHESEYETLVWLGQQAGLTSSR